MAKSIEQIRAELDALNRRNIVASGPDGSESGEAIPPLGDSDGGPATEEELSWFRENHPGKPVNEADGPIRVRRQWRNFWGEEAAGYGW